MITHRIQLMNREWTQEAEVCFDHGSSFHRHDIQTFLQKCGAADRHHHILFDNHPMSVMGFWSMVKALTPEKSPVRWDMVER